MTDHRILIADDDRLILSTLSQGLRDAGYGVLEASDGKAAAHLCEAETPDLAILDVRMPTMSGVEAARLIRQNTDVPILFLSAYSEMEIVTLAVKEGALGYLVKPVDMPQIAPAIETALARAAELKALRDSERSLNAALDSSREISMAVGLIMERYRLSQQAAFQTLRQYARSNRMKIKHVAEELLGAQDRLNIPREFLP